MPPGVPHDHGRGRRAADAQRLPAQRVAPYPRRSGAAPERVTGTPDVKLGGLRLVIWAADRPAGIFFPRVCGLVAHAHRLRSTPVHTQTEGLSVANIKSQ